MNTWYCYARGLLMLLAFVGSFQRAAGQSDFVLLRSTEETIDSLPVMVPVSDTAAIYKITQQAINNTFMGQSIRLYDLAQQYLINQGKLIHPEPAYLAITTHQGGYAKTGFILRTGDQEIRKPDAHYIDLTEDNLRAPWNRLQSITQLYPHELMHVMFKLLSSGKDSIQSFNVNMHFFSVMTDYNTAFNEGLAESMENVARLYERNDSIRTGLADQVKRVEKYVNTRGQGFIHDAHWPLRLDYYAVSMLVWYSQFEDYKRFVFARNNEETFLRPATSRTLRHSITLRNSGVENPKQKKKNQVQCMASEGFVSTFFTHLAEGPLPTSYREPTFYKNFLEDTTQQVDPRVAFSPVENLFMKYFQVLHRHVSYEKSEKAQLLDFMVGYQREFPDEAPVLLNLYKELSGKEFSTEFPTPLWFLVRNYQHPALVMDPYGGLTVPIYTFDINMAESEDLLTLPGFTKEDAEVVIASRERNGLFLSYENVFTIPALPESARTVLRNQVMDKTYFDSLGEENLDIMAMIVAPLMHLLQEMLIWFLAFLLLIYLVHPKDRGVGNAIVTGIKYFFLWLLFVIIGLTAVIVNGNAMTVVVFALGMYACIAWLVLRKNHVALKRNLMITGSMWLIIFYSVL
ncbi:MAG: hypothetical protein DYG99_12425 [Bacteroidetes bacterium CHB5]|nr:hypothetical protein [Bacteroidetes bacterium CHB5]